MKESNLIVSGLLFCVLIFCWTFLFELIKSKDERDFPKVVKTAGAQCIAIIIFVVIKSL